MRIRSNLTASEIVIYPLRYSIPLSDYPNPLSHPHPLHSTPIQSNPLLESLSHSKKISHFSVPVPWMMMDGSLSPPPRISTTVASLVELNATLVRRHLPSCGSELSFRTLKIARVRRALLLSRWLEILNEEKCVRVLVLLLSGINDPYTVPTTGSCWNGPDESSVELDFKCFFPPSCIHFNRE
ncbi:hypothetical protein ASPBRDRAFT_523468 [Aspergillus brasiliensis CBS 101740]|uniref:Uncharacterized protein n=1 Tax=Aspergillus brasiliensis (strain CBS 101740 / IMI 381727 / IBT 21946) TaxID=767769 RepID=A0A1L9UQA9_ASPBC|nr:hypothetical protein ASPBRDRAFT_523468 [Aspergillus brasiliensis CBS 101740]